MSINVPKMWFNFVTSLHFTLITTIWGSNIEIRIWNLACWLLIYSYYTCNTFFENLKFWILQQFSPQKLIFEILRVKIQESRLAKNSIYFVLTPFVCDLLQYSLICDRYSWRPFFTQNRMTWRHWNFIFSKIVQPNLIKLSDLVTNWCQIRYW